LAVAYHRKVSSQHNSESFRLGVTRSAWRWWCDKAEQEGWFAATCGLVRALWEFARESTPERRRQRYGDAEFDWDYRVDTTSGTVGWRNRLLGMFHSPYQPTEATLFHEMMAGLRELGVMDFGEFVFVDLGSGKGRTLLMASDYPFRRIVGVELLPELHRAALENLRKYKSEQQKCFAMESICGDAAEFVFPAEPIVLYLFNPLPEAGLRKMIANLEESFRKKPREVYVLYHNPLLAQVLNESGALKRIGGTHQYAVYGAGLE
jgi:hypothetical protein